MNKTDLINAVADRLGNTTSKKDVTIILNHTFGIIQDALTDGQDVAIVDFGAFKVKEAGARTGRNPHTGETIQIPAKKKVTFKPGKALKETVKG